METTSENVAQAKAMLEKLGESWSQYETVQSELELLVESEAVDRETFEAAFFALSSKIQLIINSVNAELPTASNNLAARSRNDGYAQRTVRHQTAHNAKSHKAIFELPGTSRENPVSLRQIIDATKIDMITLKEWQTSLPDAKSISSFKQMTEFLLRKCQALETVSKKAVTSAPANTDSKVIKAKNTSSFLANVKEKCPICKDEHFIFHCQKFLGLSTEQRFQQVKSHKLCTVYALAIIKSESANSATEFVSSESEAGKEGQAQDTVVATSARIDDVSNATQVLLSTAMVKVYDRTGKSHNCRALLDNGSQSHFITKDLARRLDLKTKQINVTVSGIGRVASQANDIARLKIGSNYNAFQTTIDCMVINRITNRLPSNRIDSKTIDIPKNINLADPNFHIPADIDLLIGAEIFWQLTRVGQIKRINNQVILQKTQLGWLVAGKISTATKILGTLHCHLSINNDELDKKLTQFWHIEDCSISQAYTREERSCEEYFRQTTRRNEQGRFIVRLPTKEKELEKLGESKSIATRRFYSLERKFRQQPKLKQEYVEFMKEYLMLGHMQRIKDDQEVSDHTYYLPHHAIIKQASITTKLRVVFDASYKTSSGISLNDALKTGPTIQQDLFSIVIRFRTFTYVLNADITKMYRQVMVDATFTPLQRIVWHEEDQNLETFELLTITYGQVFTNPAYSTSSASFLATRCLKQLAESETVEYPRATEAIARDFYMDDLLTRADSIHEARILRDQIIGLLARGCFQLRKWSSNSNELLEELHGAVDSDSLLTINKEADNRTLVPTKNNKEWVTKRSIMSQIAQIFDPLGLVEPILTKAKRLTQRLWQLQIDWDASVPTDIHTEWLQFQEECQVLNTLRVPRLIIDCHPYVEIQIHGFCDASIQAHGACVYFRVTDKHDKHFVKLACSKSRVASLKCISLPRLELCGAVLLAKLLSKVENAVPRKFNRRILWSDSTIVLAWLKSSSRNFNTFVANRVSEVQQRTTDQEWRHVPTEDNPADLISRGLFPAQLINSSIWWKGPEWLQLDSTEWPQLPDSEVESPLPERRQVATHLVTGALQGDDEVYTRYSELDKLIRITAWCLRFYTNCENGNRITGPLSSNELNVALIRLCKQVQQAVFKSEIQQLSNQQNLASKSQLLGLSPFLDQEGVLRVGGRLKNSMLTYTAKHQVLLPTNHVLTRLIIQYYHKKNLHAGPQSTLAAVRQRFWPLAAKSVTRKIVRNCVTCFRTKPLMSQAKMGDLPAARVQPSKPFQSCGVDYGGPLYIKEGRRRNARLTKAYIALLVCFTTKAVHIELVSDMSSEAFINALKRFISRRRKIANIYSDNGTNFVGASRELQELHRLFNDEQHTKRLQKYLTEDSISWQFIPPNAPNFGGLWEAGIKSAKTHLKKIVGQAALTYEEMYTLLTQIEAVLNSRPITGLTEDPNNISFLTPGHFLIGEPLNYIPEPDMAELRTNRLSRWQRVEQMQQQFWKRWSVEYLHQLQQRTKWKTSKGRQLHPGQLVLIQQKELTPMQWMLGRVLKVHTGSDGIARVATVKTVKGELDRPLAKLCILPLEMS
ncbi:PREDICTED: uncharacterized protein LOC108764844 [Trachymyrmex cornetzi]|uniref:uncharacterized protein LOC108764844 n=1 Tax=Trachymyrmex cornetzi TaxID=471704 RepID=UPI00084F506B|nr:PREDICTED: uncharacterized protein LOC108764844 [Trachymyrmex cornetzi]